MRALLIGRRQKHLHRRIGEHDGSDVAAFDHEIAPGADAPLLVDERCAHGGGGGGGADRFVDTRGANGVGHLDAVDEHALGQRVALDVPEGNLAGTGDAAEAVLVI